MSNLSPEARSNVAEFSVSEISGALKRVVEDTFGHVRVRGEISGYRGPHSSGHAYFALKDDKARLEAVIWRTAFQKLRFPPEEGMEVIATGRLTTYPGSSKYQIVIDSIEPAGAGALMALLEERRTRLGAEGLFDATRKRPLPFMPRVVGVVTSPTGAVIRDIIHRITDRFPIHVLVWPVRVQGETTGAEVAAAVSGFNELLPDGPIPRPDVLIVARGGGSLEDLWGFNDEAVVRAVAASQIPVVSAVGHETDWTLIDHAADVRAPTPTGAAEFVVPVRAELAANLARLHARLRACGSRSIERKRERLRACARALPSADQLLAMPRRRLDEAGSRLARGFVVSVERKHARLQRARLSGATLAHRLQAARRRLERGGEQLPKCARAYVRRRRSEFREVAVRLRIEPVIGLMGKDQTALAALARRAERAVDIRRRMASDALERSARLLASLSYRSVLNRGFAVIRDAGGTPLTSAAAISVGDELALEFRDGTVEATAGTGASPRPKPVRKAPVGGAGGQGSLF